MPCRAILFDLDGTLLDTLADIGGSANEVLAELGRAPHPLDSYRRFIGDGVRTLFRRAIEPEAASEELLDRCTAAFGRTYGRNWQQQTRPYDGIPELLAALAARGIRMAVLSNKPDVFTRQCVEAFFPPATFAAVYGERPDVPRKPDPAGARRILDELAVEPAECLYLGDLWGCRSGDELRAHGARVVIAHPLDLLAVAEAA
jgi:phosphoglycolate phosphatase